MGRERHQDGWVEPVGKKVKKWRGHYYLYERQADGSEKRRHRIADLGLRSERKKWEAEKELRAIIAKETSKAPKPSPELTLRWFYENRFLPMKKWKDSSAPKTKRFIETYLLKQFGESALGELDRFTLQTHLNGLAEKYSKSVVQKFRVYMNSILDEALEQDFVGKNQARKLEVPETKKKPSERVLAQEEIAELLAAIGGRDRLIVRMLMVLGLRPGELFALRRNDRFAPGQLRIDETVSEELRGEDRLVEPKSEASDTFVWLPRSIEQELDFWLDTMEDQRPEAFIFASKTGTPMNLNNFLRRNLKPSAEAARKKLTEEGRELPDGFLQRINHQVFRRTCATQMQHLGSVKDVQSHLRHASPTVTLEKYMKQIPESVRLAVERLDEALMERARQ